MAGVTTYSCTKCRPVDTEIIEAYLVLTNTSKAVSQQEAGRVAAENARVLAEQGRAQQFAEDHGVAQEDHRIASGDHTLAVADHGTASDDHVLAVADHGTASDDHTASTSATTRANNAAAAAEHMVDIHQGPPGPAGKAPVVGANGNWWTWDDETEAYVDSGEQAQGPVGATPDISIGTVTTGDPGDPAAASMGGTAAAPILNLTIPKGQKGDQGNTGSSVAYPFELVNNETTDDATKAHTAQGAKRLKDEISQLEAKVNNADLLVERQIDVASQAKRSYFLNLDTQTYGTTSTYKHCVVDLEGAKMVRIQAGAEEDAQIAFFTSFDIASSGGTAPMLPTYYTIPAGTTKEIVIPVGAVALYFYAGTSSTGYKYAPTKLVFITPSVGAIDAQFESGYVIPSVRDASGMRVESSIAIASGNTIKFFPVKKDDVLVVDFTHSGTNYRQGFTTVTPGTGASVSSYSAFSTAPKGRLRITAPFDGFYCASDVTSGISVFSPKIIRKTLANEVLKDATSLKAEAVADYVNPLRQIDIMSLTKQGGGLNEAGCFSYGSTYKFILLPVSAGGRLRIVSAYGTEAILAWFNQLPESTTGNAFAPFVENTARFTVSGDETFTVPDGAMYLYIYLGSSPYGIAPTFVGYAQPLSSSSSAMIDNSDNQTVEFATRRTARAVSIGLKPLSYNLDENGWEIPATLQQLNAIKKAKQLCGLKWTPKSAVPLPNGTAAAGVQRTGVNYSSPVELEKYVGVGVSFHTFMTAINNPYSLQYTENINEDNSSSIWGFTYKDGKGYAYYGTACNGFVCACLEMVIEYANNAYHGRLTDAMIVTPLVPQSVDFFQIGDIIDTNTHAIMIYGIRRDSDGTAVGFKTAESTSAYNGCIIKDYTREELVDKINLSGFIAYRYNELWKNWDYKPSPYVPIDDEPEQIVTYNDDICTFAGDEASFRVGDLVVLNYNLSDSPSHNWTGIEVYKDDVLIDTYLLSAIDQNVLPVGQRGHALKLGTSLEAGKYKARLTDGENYYSDYTKWEVLSVVSTVLEKDNECLGVTIEAESNATPKYVMVGTVSGDSFTSLKGRLLTDEEIESGHFDLYINGVGRDNPLYIRFIADGDYGRVRTLPEVTEPTS